MEGVFVSEEIINKFGEKSGYKMCSFSGEKGFSNPAMWGYYAGGFKGLAIEVKTALNKDLCVDQDGVYQVIPKDDLPNERCMKKVLLNKTTRWEHEYEYRFLIKSNDNSHKIGKITAIIFGNPYGNISNKEDIKAKSKSLRQYESLKKEMIEIASGKNIPCFNARNNGINVSKGDDVNAI